MFRGVAVVAAARLNMHSFYAATGSISLRLSNAMSISVPCHRYVRIAGPDLDDLIDRWYGTEREITFDEWIDNTPVHHPLPRMVMYEYRRHRRAHALHALRALRQASRTASAVADAAAARLLLLLGVAVRVRA